MGNLNWEIHEHNFKFQRRQLIFGKYVACILVISITQYNASDWPTRTVYKNKLTICQLGTRKAVFLHVCIKLIGLTVRFYWALSLRQNRRRFENLLKIILSLFAIVELPTTLAHCILLLFI